MNTEKVTRANIRIILKGIRREIIIPYNPSVWRAKVRWDNAGITVTGA